MESQNFTLLVSLGSSISAVLISSLTSVWLKHIEAKQKRQERNLEFSKAYAIRKMDAGEAVIGRNNLLISRIRTLEQLISAYVQNYGYYYESGEKRVDDEVEKTNQLLLTDKASYRLYFNSDEINESISEANHQHTIKLNIILGKLDEMRNFVSEFNETKQIIISKENAGKFNKIKNELNSDLSEFLTAGQICKKLLIKDCSRFRDEMSKYDLPS